MALEGQSSADQPAPPDAGVVRRLDHEDLIASLRGMSMGERLEAGFELCEFASQLAGAAHRSSDCLQALEDLEGVATGEAETQVGIPLQAPRDPRREQ